VLAVKLHKRKTPYLGRGSFLVPIRTWLSGKIHVKNWICLLERFNQGRPNNAVRYISLVKIPDSHPVFLGLDWSVKMIQGVEFTELAQIDDAIKQALDLAPFTRKSRFTAPKFVVHNLVPGRPIVEYPELILGCALPASFIKWTKDVRLLYRGDTRRGN